MGTYQILMILLLFITYLHHKVLIESNYLYLKYDAILFLTFSNAPSIYINNIIEDIDT